MGEVRAMRKLFVLACLVTLTVGTVSAKEVVRKSSEGYLTGNTVEQAGPRIGIGYSQQLTSHGLTSLAARFWATRSFGYEAIFGFQLGDNTIFDFGGKILGAIKHEQNMTVYGFGILGIENIEFKKNSEGNSSDQSITETMTTFGGGFGVEFFFQGLPNLSFNTEIGVEYRNPSKTSGVATFAGQLGEVGMRYYFN